MSSRVVTGSSQDGQLCLGAEPGQPVAMSPKTESDIKCGHEHFRLGVELAHTRRSVLAPIAFPILYVQVKLNMIHQVIGQISSANIKVGID